MKNDSYRIALATFVTKGSNDQDHPDHDLRYN